MATARRIGSRPRCAPSIRAWTRWPTKVLARVRAPSGEWTTLHDLFARDPDYYFGREHAERLGAHPGFLAKLLDSAMRLHVQAHPTAAFAREHLGSPWGKLEAYVILALRDAEHAYIRLGFQRPPSPSEWRRIVLEQDIAAMDACFDPIPVRVGEVWLVPGGLPHAIGEGILMLEVMEPSDLVVRCEFVREGVEVPPEARFMGATRGPGSANLRLHAAERRHGGGDVQHPAPTPFSLRGAVDRTRADRPISP